jgi:hypothetical protein
VIEAEKAFITLGERAEDAQLAQTTTATASLDVWHVRLGHISTDSVLKMVRSGMVKGMDIIGNVRDTTIYCDECEASGHSQTPIPTKTLTHTTEVLGQVFSDVCKVETVTCEGYRYFITFIDDFS